MQLLEICDDTVKIHWATFLTGDGIYKCGFLFLVAAMFRGIHGQTHGVNIKSFIKRNNLMPLCKNVHLESELTKSLSSVRRPVVVRFRSQVKD